MVLSATLVAVTTGSTSETIPTPSREAGFAIPILEHGMLSVTLLAENTSTFWPPQDILVYTQLSGQSVVISSSAEQSASAPSRLITVVTNSNGSLRTKLPVGNDYLFTISDPRFHLSVPFRILPNETTKATVAFKRLAFPVAFSEYDDRFGTGFIGGIGGTVFLRIASRISIEKVHLAVTLELMKDSNSSMMPGHQSGDLTLQHVQARVFGETLTNDATYLQVLPEAEMKIERILKMTVIIYDPSYLVEINPD